MQVLAIALGVLVLAVIAYTARYGVDATLDLFALVGVYAFLAVAALAVAGLRAIEDVRGS